MLLKNYQLNTLNVLQQFFEKCRISGPVNAYRDVTGDPEILARLGKLKDDYIVWDSIPNTPRICVKVPTGGGKTIIGAHAIKIVSDTWCEKENPVVLWVVPSDSIRTQTSDALKNPRHPYRMVLDEQFGGRVKVFDLDQKFEIRPADIENNVCIIVTTIQAFRQTSTEKYKVYAHNENLEPHFTRITAKDGMEFKEDGSIKFSFANLLHYNNPIMIVDEAHNEVSKLSQETFGRLNPSAMIELTATPQLKNNTLYNVRATELKEEEMIKLPIELREHISWESAVTESIAKRAELETAAQHEKDYVRPIILFQAQDKNGEVNAAALKQYLIDIMNLPESEIAIVTSDQKELDGINVFLQDCPIRYIITVDALKEGWDCSFAYILCSLANVQSNTAIEQLLGRVMRMPYAKNRKISALNKAYAYVISKSFGESAGTLVKKLKENGFDESEAESAIQQKPSELDGLFGRHDNNKIDIERQLTALEVPQSIKLENNGKTIVFTNDTSVEDLEMVCASVSEKTANDIKTKFYNYQLTKRNEAEPSAAEQGESFSLPKMMVSFGEQDEFVFAEPDLIFEKSDWDILKYANPQLTPSEFSIENQGNGFIINLDGNLLNYTPSGEQLNMPFANVENWTVSNLVIWLDKRLRQDDIPQPKMVEWLRQIIEYLINIRGIQMTDLMFAKYALANKIESKIFEARKKAREQNFNQYIFGRESRIMLNFDNGFTFRAGVYDNEPIDSGSYKFAKHFLGSNKVPKMDGDEEYECAKAIDSIPEVKYWIRNVSRHPSSFRLPTSTDYFYPDFIALLNDGRILVIEYKGEHLITASDTKEKVNIGELWEKQSKNHGLFLLVGRKIGGLNPREQIQAKIGKL